jgi:WD40-like Beta Propeller Repeat
MRATACLALVVLAAAAPARAAVIYRCGNDLCRVPDAGGLPTPLTTDGTPAAPYGSPSLSADGTRLAFGHGGQVYVAEANAQHPVAVPGAQDAVAVKLRPDGERVAFVTETVIGPRCEPGGVCPGMPSRLVFHLKTARPDGSGLREREVASGEFGWLGDALMAISPDYHSVCVLRGSRCRHILAGPLPTFMAAFALSPDGHLLAAGRRGGGYGIALFSTRTRQLVRLLTASRFDAQPTWSPDGRSILFTRAGGIYRLRLDRPRQPLLVARGVDPTTGSARPPAPRPRRR